MAAEVMRFMLPYDQDAHPVDVARTAPYGIVNHWMSVEGQFGRGGATFLSGSITTALRNVYGGMMGFDPTLDGLRFDPTIPASWKRLSYRHNYLGATLDVSIENRDGVESGVVRIELDGRRIDGDTVGDCDISAGARTRRARCNGARVTPCTPNGRARPASRRFLPGFLQHARRGGVENWRRRRGRVRFSSRFPLTRDSLFAKRYRVEGTGEYLSGARAVP